MGLWGELLMLLSIEMEKNVEKTLIAMKAVKKYYERLEKAFENCSKVLGCDELAEHKDAFDAENNIIEELIGFGNMMKLIYCDIAKSLIEITNVSKNAKDSIKSKRACILKKLDRKLEIIEDCKKCISVASNNLKEIFNSFKTVIYKNNASNHKNRHTEKTNKTKNETENSKIYSYEKQYASVKNFDTNLTKKSEVNIQSNHKNDKF